MKVAYIKQLYRTGIGLSALNSKIVLGSGMMVVASVALTVGAILTTSMTARTLNPEEFGVWVLIYSLWGYVSNLDLGLGTALRNKLATLSARTDHARADGAEKGFFLSAFFAMVSISLSGVFCVLALALFWPQPLHLFNATDVTVAQESTEALVYVLVVLFLCLPLRLYMPVFFAYQLSYLNAVIDIVRSALVVVGIALLVSWGSSLLSLNLAFPVVVLVTSFAGLVWAMRRQRWSLARIGLTQLFQQVFELLPMGLLFTLLAFTHLVFVSVGPWLVNSLIGVAEAGEFSLFLRLALFGYALQTALLMPLWSAYTRAASAQDWFWCRRVFLLSVVVSTLLLSVMAVGLVIFGNSLVLLWTGKQFTGNSSLRLGIAIWMLVYGWATTFAVLLNGLGVIRLEALAMTASAVLLVVLGYLLIPSMGIAGAAWGMAISALPAAIAVTVQVLLIFRRASTRAGLGLSSPSPV